MKGLSDLVRIYRDRSHKTGKDEYLEQIDFYQWFLTEYPYLKMAMFHPVNEQKGAVQYQQKLLQMGRLPGVSDLIFLHQVGPYPYAVFEMKRRHIGTLTKDQKKFLNYHAEAGAFVCLCYGAEQAKIALNDYLNCD